MYVLGRDYQICLLWLCGLLATSSFGQRPPAGARPANNYDRLLRLTLVQEEAINRSWQLSGAELREEAFDTWGFLEIRNVLGAPVQQAKFYVEYYDSLGRLCFTLVFSSDANIEQLRGDTRPVESSESRLLVSVGVGLAPASEAVEARVHLVSQTTVGRPEVVVEGNRVIRSPGSIHSIPDRELGLALGPQQQVSPVLDLIFARIVITKEGEIDDLTILNSASPVATAWFERIIRGKGVLRPATIGFANTESAELVLVRIASGTNPISVVPAARESPWVKSYVGALRDRALRPIAALFFLSPAESIALSPESEQPRSASKSGPNVLQLVSVGSFWCDTLVVWDPASPPRPWTLRWRTPAD